MKPFLSYIRVSDTAGRKGRDSYGSPAEQRRDNDSTARRFGLTIGSELIHEDVSGGNVEERLAPVLAEIRAGRLGGIVVRFFDRFSRDDVLDSLLMVREIRDAGGEVYASNYSGPVIPDDWQTFSDAKASKAYRDRIREEWAAAKRRAHDRGAFNGKTPPGYERENGCLVAGPLAPLIDTIYRKKLAGDSYAELARYAQANGLPTITVGGIRKILENPVYIGQASQGASPAIIEVELFRLVQSMRHRREATGMGAKTLCQGIARCANCGLVMVVQTNGSYYCRGLRAEGCDKRGNISIRILDEWVSSLFQDKASLVDPIARAYVDETALQEASALRSSKHYELEQLKTSTSLISTLGIEAFEQMVANAQAGFEIADAAFREAKANTDLLGGLGRMVVMWRDGKLTLDEKRRLIPRVIDRIEVSNGRAPVERKARVIFKDGTVLGAPDDALPSFSVVEDRSPLVT